MQKNKNIINIIAIGPLIFIPLLVIIISLYIAKSSSDNLEINIHKLESQLALKEKQLIQIRVDSIAQYIAYRKSIIKKNLTNRIKKRVNNAYRVATSIYEKYKDTKTSKEIKEIIISALRPMVWNNEESFIWVLDYKGMFYLAPRYLKKIENTSIINFKDANGRYVIQDEISICKNKKEGFLRNTFTRQNYDITKQFEQVSFVKAFGYFDWYFGSGEYLDTAQGISDANLLESLKKMYEFQKNYIMIGTMNGDLLLHKGLAQFVGKNVKDMDNSALEKIYIQAINGLKTKNSIFISYNFINPQTNKEQIKTTYFRKVENSDWVVASGYHESTIKNLLAKKSIELYKSHEIEVEKLVTISIILILISSIISYILSRYIKKSFYRYENEINHKSTELNELNENLERRVQKRTKELKELTRELEVLATTDSLTNIHNRYSIMNMLNIEINRAKRNNQSLCVIMYDIDFFKNINDKFGHDMGDKILKELSVVVKNSLRFVDILGRYGGEEFLIIMPSTSFEDAKEIAQRTREEVENHKFINSIKITISLGLVNLKTDENIDAIFKRLDNLLYDSKHAGRNTICY